MTKMLTTLPVASIASTAPGVGKLVVVIDRQVQNYEQLVEETVPDAEVILLEPLQDGVHQITAVLARYGFVSSLHLVCHGTAGTLQLGNTSLSAATLSRYTHQLQQWADVLGPTGELLIYGCEVAQGDRGLALVSQLSQLTRVAIAASTTKIGSAALGGNWHLDTTTGVIRALPIFSEQVRATYSGLLAIDSASITTGTFTGGDVGEGLDLEGRFVYAVNMGGPAVGLIRDATFTTDTISGVTVVSRSTTSDWFTVDYGPTQNDNRVETLVSSIRWSRNPGVVQVDLANLTLNRTYKAQLLFSEAAGYNERYLDITAEDQIVVDNFNPSAIGGYADNLKGAVVTFEFTASDTILNLLISPAGSGLGADQNPYINALTLEVIGTPELTNPISDQTAVEDIPFSFTLPENTFTDPDGDPLSVTATLRNGDPLPSWLSFDANTRIFSGTPSNSDVQPSEIRVTASDGRESISDLFNLAVTPVNDAPVLAPTTLELEALQEDAGAPVGAVGTLVSALVNLQPPVGGVDNVSDVDNTVTGIAITATDTANGTWFYSLDNGASWSDIETVSPTSALLLAADSNSRIYFQPEPNYNGSDSGISFRAWDQTSGTAGTRIDTSTNGGSTAFSSNLGRAVATILPVNDLPTLTGTTATLAEATEDSEYSVRAADLLQGFSDADNDRLGVVVDGVAVDETGIYTFTPPTNFNGTLMLHYSVVDGNGAIVPVTQTVAIAPVNDTPTGTAISTLAAGTEDTAYLISEATLLAGFSDIDGDALAIADLTATNGVLVRASDGNYTFTPAANFNGTVNLSYTVIDPSGAGVSASQSFSLSAVNDAPIVSLSAPTTPVGIGIPTTISAVVGDLDLGGDNANLPLQATLSATQGSLTLTADALSELVITDGANGTGSLTVQGSVTAINAVLARFTYIGSSIGTASITVVVNDLGNGGGTALSADTTQTLTLVNAQQGTSAGETLTGTVLTDYLYGFAGDDTLDGLADNDLLEGGAGNDSLEGGSGADLMRGGAGDDTYTVDNIGDKVEETANSGTDTVISAITYTLSANVENLVLQQDSGAINAIGNTLSNTLQGNNNANLLNGGAGADTLSGGAANDTYVIDNVGDVVIEADSAGSDRVQSSLNYTLPDNVENLVLSGTATNGSGNRLNNNITGNSLNNILNGGTGTDTLQGGRGNDLYIVDQTNDIVQETVDAGNDIVQSSVSYSLSSNVEELQLTGSTAINGTGNGLNNTLVGNSAVNTLNGGAGEDTLRGGDGNDLYRVDQAGDVVIEQANEGTDTITSSVTYGLPNHVEALTLTGTTAINGTGNQLNNRLTGNSAANLLDGGSGQDTLSGGTGDDSYVISDGDVVIEASNGGTDTIYSAFSCTLAANIENLELTTNIGNLNGTGNALANIIIGNDGNNTLDGKGGNDTLVGGNGNDVLIGGLGGDTLTGSAGNNIFRYLLRTESPGGANQDTITDFADGDRIDLRALYPVSLTFVDGDFTALGQVRYSSSTGLLQANLVDGLLPDFEIFLATKPVLNRSPLLV